MKIHRAGYRILLVSIMVLIVLNILIVQWVHWLWLLVPSVILMVLILQFFRKPDRPVANRDSSLLYAPADGKVVVLEQSRHSEIPGEQCIQVSIFMSPLNVHINWAPTDATVMKHNHFPGKYLMAWNPKSSEENEQYTSVWKSSDGHTFVLKQIAGFMARRIIPYIESGQHLKQGEEIGFIRFGSRVDLLLPLDTEIEVRKGDQVKGKQTVMARLKES